jgi:SAM-dependent methyltransferase
MTTETTSSVSDSEVERHPELTRRSNYEPAWPQETFIVPLLRREIEQALQQFASPVSLNEWTLDVGCGRQPFRQALSAMGYKYLGFDVEQNEERNVDVLGAIDRTLPDELLNGRKFGFILCTEVLEHVADWKMAFENLSCLLEDGGKLLITCPHFYQLHEEPHDFWRPTLHGLRFYSDANGLRTVFSKKIGDGWDVLGTVLANIDVIARERKFTHRLAAKVLRGIKNWMLEGLRRGLQHRHVTLNSPLYLSNVVVLQKV